MNNETRKSLQHMAAKAAAALRRMQGDPVPAGDAAGKGLPGDLSLKGLEAGRGADSLQGSENEDGAERPGQTPPEGRP